jgi:hypothetical protein
MNPLESVLRDMWAKLGVHVTRTTQSFYDYGGSSLVAMQFLYPKISQKGNLIIVDGHRNKFQTRFNETLSFTDFMKDPTIGSIAKKLDSLKLPLTISNYPSHASDHCNVDIICILCLSHVVPVGVII